MKQKIYTRSNSFLKVSLLLVVILTFNYSAQAQQELYALEGNSITKVDLSTGNTTPVVTFPASMGGVFRFTYHPGNDLFYAIGNVNLTINAAGTAVATSTAQTLISIDICNDIITVIDTITVVDTNGVLVNLRQAEGFDYDLNTDMFYIVGNDQPSFTSNRLMTLDITTAIATVSTNITQTTNPLHNEADLMEFSNVNSGTSDLIMLDGAPSNNNFIYQLEYDGPNIGDANYLADPYLTPTGNVGILGFAYNSDDNLLYAIDRFDSLVTVEFLGSGNLAVASIVQLPSGIVNMEWGTPNCCPYEIPDVALTCDSLDCVCCGTPTICIPFNVKDTIQNGMIGLDFCINYDEQYLTPTGNVDLGPVVLNGSTSAGYAINYVMTPGQLHVSVFYQSGAPMGTNFVGFGEIACVEFQLSPTYTTGDTLDFTVCEVMEGFEVGVELECADPGTFVLVDDTELQANIIYWNDASKPLRYDTLNPASYLETWVSGTDDTCAVINSNVTLPDSLGQFTYDVSNGNSIQIMRDIQGDFFSTAPCPSPNGVMSAINGMDAYWMKLVTTLNGSFVPNVYQIIAMDVTMDGIVAGNDITQLNRRIVGLTCEYPQDWNDYPDTITGTPPTANSLDWRFIDRTTVETDPAYTVSGIYPTNDSIGYSRYNVPNVPLCLEVPSDSNGVYCTTIPDQTYNGILLGDVNASWNGDDTIANYLKVNSEVIYALDEATKDENCVINVPVYYNLTGNLMALDFTMDYDESKLTVEDAITNNGFSNPMSMAFNDLNNDMLLLTSYSSQPGGFSSSSPIYYLQFTSVNDVILDSDLGAITSYLNGIEATSTVQGSIADCQMIGTLNIDEEAQMDADIYPNPFDDVLYIEFGEESAGSVQIELLDMKGRKVLISESKGQSSVVIRTNNLPSGMYMLYVNGMVHSKVVKY